MGNIVVDNTIEFLKDESTGELVGYKRKDGTERGIATTVVDPATGGGLNALCRLMPSTLKARTRLSALALRSCRSAI